MAGPTGPIGPKVRKFVGQALYPPMMGLNPECPAKVRPPINKKNSLPKKLYSPCWCLSKYFCQCLSSQSYSLIPYSLVWKNWFLNYRLIRNCRHNILSFELTLRTPSSKLSVVNVVRRPASSDGLRRVSATNLPESPILQSPRRNANGATQITEPLQGYNDFYISVLEIIFHCSS